MKMLQSDKEWNDWPKTTIARRTGFSKKDHSTKTAQEGAGG